MLGYGDFLNLGRSHLFKLEKLKSRLVKAKKYLKTIKL